MRGSLVEVLREYAAHAGVRIVTGRRLVGAEPTGHGIHGRSLVGYPVGP